MLSMKWLRFIYNGERREGFILNSEDIHGNMVIYQVSPVTGVRSFKPKVMYETQETTGLWTHTREISDLYSRPEVSVFLGIFSLTFLALIVGILL